MSDLFQQFEEWCNEHNTQPEHIRDMMIDKCKQEQEQEIISRYESHRHLIGNYYYHDHAYYKVISIKANNEYRVSCLVFYENPSYNFTPLLHKARTYSDYEGTMCLDCIYVDDFLVSIIEGWQQISETEYRIAYEHFFNTLYGLEWDN